MKKFTSLIDGLNYVIVCPICHKPTDLNDLDANILPLSGMAYIPQSNKNFKGKLQFDLYDTDLLNIDVLTEKIELIRDYSISGSGRNTQNLYDGGILIVRLGIDCNECCQYGYLLQISIDLEKMIVNGVYLDSEILSIEKGNVVHEIRNSYSRSETNYDIINRSREHATQMTSDGMHEIEETIDTVDKSIMLPLFPLDINNPEETLQRINKLIVFS